jgi:hypothetical protein
VHYWLACFFVCCICEFCVYVCVCASLLATKLTSQRLTRTTSSGLEEVAVVVVGSDNW